MWITGGGGGGAVLRDGGWGAGGIIKRQTYTDVIKLHVSISVLMAVSTERVVSSLSSLCRLPARPLLSSPSDVGGD